ncbi:MAG: biopolymer transporter ExbD, partial [Phycisphaerales bacterium]
SRRAVFNMTPVIDIVFLLIVFLVVVCHFIETEDFAVQVPDECDLSQDASSTQVAPVTITVTRKPDGQVEFAVGAARFDLSEAVDLSARIAEEVDLRLGDYSDEQRVVALRVDKSIAFSDVKYALAGVSASRAAYVRLATYKSAQAEGNGRQLH